MVNFTSVVDVDTPHKWVAHVSLNYTSQGILFAEFQKENPLVGHNMFMGIFTIRVPFFCHKIQRLFFFAIFQIQNANEINLSERC